ncbi:MAG: hypothetical protein ABSD92_02440 [Candidatus Bathyarchaeia archaeon]
MNTFDWNLFPKAESLLQTELDKFLSSNNSAATLVNEIEQKTSTRIFDWVDHLVVSSDEIDADDLFKRGFHESRTFEGSIALRVEGSTLFPMLLRSEKMSELALAVEDIDNFRKVYGKDKIIQGTPNSGFRKLVLISEKNFLFSVVERRGFSGYTFEDKDDVDYYVEASNALRSRRRTFSSAEEGILETEKLLTNFGSRIGKLRLAYAFFRAERRFWESQNHAATVQRSRQDGVGAGWGNVDHYTFRSSRQSFSALIRIFELLGLNLRERFHAGAQAGWGAQILEDADGRNVVFADVDLSKEEKDADFAHQGLDPRDELGTVGLWVGLHGESILEAGMHHLAARFRFDDVREDFKGIGVGMRKPFSNFPFLKQAFTEPEKWRVENDKLSLLVKKHQLNEEQALAFARDGAVASHLESIQRGQGFKGFNQNSVSAIIKWTNPLAQQETYA